MIARVMESGPVRKGREDLEDLVEQTVMELPGVPQEALMRRLVEKHAEMQSGKPGHRKGDDLFRMRCAEALRDLRDKGRVARGPVAEPPRWWPIQEGGMDA